MSLSWIQEGSDHEVSDALEDILEMLSSNVVKRPEKEAMLATALSGPVKVRHSVVCSSSFLRNMFYEVQMVRVGGVLNTK